MHLTPRENEVVGWLLQGCSNKEIAEHMHIATKTVKLRMKVLFIKFGIEGNKSKRVALAVKAFHQRGRDGQA